MIRAGFDGAAMTFPRAAAARGIGIGERARIIMPALGIEGVGTTMESMMKAWESLKARWLYRQ